MENESSNDVDITNNDAEGGNEDSGAEASKPEKPVETPEAKLVRLRRQTKQLEKKLGVTEEKPDVQEKQSGGLDYAKLAFLKAEGISGENAEWAMQTAKESGTELAEFVTKKWVQAELKERLEFKATATATPTGTKRSAASSRDQVEYWLAKGEFPKDQPVELQRAYVKAKSTQIRSASKFTDHPLGNVR